MPASLKYFKKDPNGLGRGAGVYYHRGKGIYSKYSSERDKKIKAKGYKIHPIGTPTKSRTLHAGDGRRPR